MMAAKTLTTLLFASVAISCQATTSSSSSSSVEHQTSTTTSSSLIQPADDYSARNLQATFDFFRDNGVDKCNNNPDPDGIPILGDCDHGRFPECEDGKEEICFNRKPSRDHFHDDTHQPIFYIQYDRVFCYPLNFGGCSSCTPGRFCRSEQRCILDEVDYPCEQWY